MAIGGSSGYAFTSNDGIMVLTYSVIHSMTLDDQNASNSTGNNILVE